MQWDKKDRTYLKNVVASKGKVAKKMKYQWNWKLQISPIIVFSSLTPLNVTCLDKLICTAFKNKVNLNWLTSIKKKINLIDSIGLKEMDMEIKLQWFLKRITEYKY